jgi:GDP-L-fucose synthase
VTGHRGLLGSAVRRAYVAKNGVEPLVCPRTEVDLRDHWAVENWFAENRPNHVIHCAGTVGGILANDSRPVDFFYDNSLMHQTVLRAAQMFGVDKLLYVGSSCIYPRDCPQPIREEYLLTGTLEPTNAAYALAKISGVMSCQFYRKQYASNFISAMPTNLYGPHDNFDLNSSHVLPALIRKFHEAKLQGDSHVTVWGSGKPRREFLHVDDLADACLFLMEHYNEPMPINVGTGEDLTIAELADVVRMIVYPEAKIAFDRSRPDGTPRKLLDVSRIHALGWKHRIDLEPGIRKTYAWFVQSQLGDDHGDTEVRRSFDVEEVKSVKSVQVDRL